MTTNGLHRTTADEQYAKGLAAGRKVRDSGLTADLAERLIRADRSLAADSSSDVFAQFHYGRIDGIEGK